MIFLIILIINNWHINRYFRPLIALPLGGLIQLLYSTVISYIYIKVMRDNQLQIDRYENAQNYNVSIISIYGIVEFYFLSKYFQCIIISNKIKKILNLTTIITTILCILSIDLIRTSPIIHHSKYISIILSFELIMFSMLALSEITLNHENKNIIQNPNFLITGAIFILFSSNFPIYYISYYAAIKSINATELINNIILSSYTLFYTIIITSILWKKRLSK